MSAHIARKDLYSLPNILTYIRLLCIPAFIVVFFTVNGGSDLNVYIAFSLFAFASVTDVLDGYIARKYATVTDLGKMLDPMADKLLQVSAAICLSINEYVQHSNIGMLFIAFPILLGMKELFMLIWGFVLAKKSIIVHSNIYGKSAAFINAVGLLMSFFARAEYNGYRIACTIVLAIGCFMAYIALIIYVVKTAKQLNGTIKNKSDMNLNF